MYNEGNGRYFPVKDLLKIFDDTRNEMNNSSNISKIKRNSKTNHIININNNLNDNEINANKMRNDVKKYYDNVKLEAGNRNKKVNNDTKKNNNLNIDKNSQIIFTIDGIDKNNLDKIQDYKMNMNDEEKLNEKFKEKENKDTNTCCYSKNKNIGFYNYKSDTKLYNMITPNQKKKDLGCIDIYTLDSLTDLEIGFIFLFILFLYFCFYYFYIFVIYIK